MRVLYAIPRYGRGFVANELHAELVGELRRLGWEVDVFALAADPPVERGEVGERIWTVRRRGWVRLLDRLLAPWVHYPYFALQVRELARVVREGGYALLDVQGAYPLGGGVGVRPPAPYTLATLGGDLFRLPDYGFVRHPIPRLLVTWALRRARIVRANSPMVAELVVHRFGVPPERVQVIPPNVGELFYRPVSEEDRRRARAERADRFDLPRGVPWVMVVGRLIPLKGQAVALEALARLHREAGPHLLICVGADSRTADGGSYRAQLEAEARRLGVADWVRFFPPASLPEVRRWLLAADLVLVPSVREGFSRVVVEALLSGAKVLAGPGVGVARWLASAGYDKLVVNEGSWTEKIAAALQETWTSEERDALRRWLTRFRSREVARELSRLYAQILEVEQGG